MFDESKRAYVCKNVKIVKYLIFIKNLQSYFVFRKAVARK